MTTVVDAKPDPAVPAKWRRWIIPAAVAIGIAFLLLAPLWAPLLLRQMAFFRVRRVEVVGARYVPARDVLDLLQVDTLASVWDPPGPLEVRVARHPLVRDVKVERDLPGTLVVRLVEHSPVALVPGAAGLRPYDARGVALPIDLTVSDVDAPVLSRPDTGLLRLLGEVRAGQPNLYERLSEIRVEARGQVVLVLDSTPVRALSDVTLQRLADLELVETHLAQRKLRATELDLRYRDQVIARLP